MLSPLHLDAKILFVQPLFIYMIKGVAKKPPFKILELRLRFPQRK
jgi:hypothetical protein